MKTKFSKILGATLALVLVFALGVALAPAPQVAASPAANKWAKFSIPSAGSLGDYILVPVDATDNASTWVDGPGPLVMSKDGDLWCYWDVDNTPDTPSSNIFRSTDEGRSWAKKGSSTSVVAEKVIVDFACSPEDNDVVFAADTRNVYKSSDGGSTWSTLAAIPWSLSGDEDITSIDATYKDGRHYIVVGTDNETGGEVYVKPDIAYEVWEVQNMTGDERVLDVAFSPNFAEETNEQVVAVSCNSSNTFVRYQYSGGNWDTKKAELLTGTSANESFGAIDGADIAFPDDYDSTGGGGNIEVFVGIDGGTPAGGDVYYITYNIPHDKNVGGTTLTLNISSIDLRGPASECSILACDKTTTNIYRSADSGGTWAASKQDPSGPAGVAYVVVADDFVDSGKAWVATDGDSADDQSAISLTTNYGKYWQQISMINTEINSLLAKGLAFSPDFATDNTMFMITTATDKNASNNDDSLWKWDGSYWSRVQDNDTESSDIAAVQVSPDFATSNTVYLVDTLDTNKMKVWYSKDGGERFIKQSSYPNSTTGIPFSGSDAWIVLDYNTVLVGGTTNAVYKATRRDGARYSTKTASFGNIMSFAVSPDYDNDTTVLLGGNGGKVGLSTNSGDTWKQKPAGVDVQSTATTCYVAFDSDFADNSIIYAAAANTAAGYKAVYRLEVDVSTGWSKISSGTDTDTPTTPVVYGADPSGIVAANGAVYCAVTVDEDGDTILVSRSVNPATGSTTSVRGVYFEAVTKSFSGSAADTANGIWLTEGTSNVLWIEETGTAGTNAIWKYEDKLIVAPTLKSPDDGASTGRTGTATLKWEAMDGASSYYIVVSGNEDFSPLVTTSGAVWTWIDHTSTTTSYSVSGLDAGSTYYWKMRSKGYAVSPWSEVRLFTTGIAGAEWNPFSPPSGVGPSAGDTDVPLRPAFQWNAADWATAYEFVLADNADFASPIVSESVATTTFALDTDLDYSTSYYWKVRATSATTESNWGTGVFTTIAKAAAPTPPVEITPAPPAPVLPTPATPVYVWAIIGIGALLVIALIVLIVRTRRVA